MSKIVKIIIIIVVCIVAIYGIMKLFPSSSPTSSSSSSPTSNIASSIDNILAPVDNTAQTPYVDSTGNNIQPFTLYYFYSNNCPNCTKFNSTWNTVSSKLANIKSLHSRKIDTDDSKNEGITFYYNIKRVPTIVLVTPNSTTEYSGAHNINDLYTFVLSTIENYYTTVQN